MDENIATYKIDLDAGKGMLYALLTIRRDALEEIGWLDAELDKLISNRVLYLSRSNIVFKVKGTLLVKFADGTEREIGDTLPVQFSHRHQPGVALTHNGEECMVFLVCGDSDELKSYNPAAAAGPDKEESESGQQGVICPVCGRRVYAEKGYEFWSAGCDNCGVYTRQHSFTEESALAEFSKVATRLNDWKVGNTVSNI